MVQSVGSARRPSPRRSSAHARGGDQAPPDPHGADESGRRIDGNGYRRWGVTIERAVPPNPAITFGEGRRGPVVTSGVSQEGTRMRAMTVTTMAGTRASDYAALAKPRLNMLVVASTAAGYVLAGGDTTSVSTVLWLVAGTGLVAGGASAFNQLIERDTDGLMTRTRLRPLPGGRLVAREALAFAVVLSLAGLLVLAAGVNRLAATVALATLGSYAAIYTPLKRRTSFATVIGAIPGALPPVIGWAGAANDLSRGAWILFAIVFLWQLPHFLAIAWMYRDDYARAGFPMLPVIEPDGRSTARQVVIYTAALLPVALAPSLVGIAGPAYFAGALALTLLFVGAAIRFALKRTNRDARRLFFASITYLPLLWLLMIADRV
jgi:protoheme IX farnesyltransferase